LCGWSDFFFSFFLLVFFSRVSALHTFQGLFAGAPNPVPLFPRAGPHFFSLFDQDRPCDPSSLFSCTPDPTFPPPCVTRLPLSFKPPTSPLFPFFGNNANRPIVRRRLKLQGSFRVSRPHVFQRVVAFHFFFLHQATSRWFFGSGISHWACRVACFPQSSASDEQAWSFQLRLGSWRFQVSPPLPACPRRLNFFFASLRAPSPLHLVTLFFFEQPVPLFEGDRLYSLLSPLRPLSPCLLLPCLFQYFYRRLLSPPVTSKSLVCRIPS